MIRKLQVGDVFTVKGAPLKFKVVTEVELTGGGCGHNDEYTDGWRVTFKYLGVNDEYIDNNPTFYFYQEGYSPSHTSAYFVEDIVGRMERVVNFEWKENYSEINKKIKELQAEIANLEALKTKRSSLTMSLT
jgi:hypothetical protein